MPPHARTRYHARWVVPVATPPVEHGTVVVEGEHIAWVGARSHAPAGGADEDLGDVVLLPGLVNAHTHVELTVMRGFLEDLSFIDWVRTLTRARAEALTAEDLADSALLGVAEGLAAGITTFGDTGDSDGPFDALRTLGARGIAFREVFGPDPDAAPASLAGLQAKVEAMRARATPLVHVGVSPHAPYSVSDRLFFEVARYAERERLPVAVHIAEGEDEGALVERAEGPFAAHLAGRGIMVEPRAPGPVALLRVAGLLRAGTLLIHCVRATTDDIRAIAHAGCGVAHCPASNAKLGHGIAPLSDMLAAGVRVGLGSDSMASNNQMELLGEARLAVLLQRARAAALPGSPGHHGHHGHHANGLSARAALRLATLGGAEALRLDAEVGSLEHGKQADLVSFSLDPRVGPVQDPVGALVFSPYAARVDRVWVAGREVVRDGRVHGLDAAIPARVSAAAARLSQWRHARTRR
jgi:cytosine/adenosine deaminase-related metal-dependent hydrolase